MDSMRSTDHYCECCAITTLGNKLGLYCVARAMLDNGHCLEAVGILHTALSGGTHTASPVMVCQTYRLLASCYSAQVPKCMHINLRN